MGIGSPEAATIEEIQSVAGVDAETLASWWASPNFQSWFRDKEHVVDKVDALFEESVDTLAEIMRTGDKEQDRLAAIRAIVDIKRELDKKKESEADGELSIEQLLPLLKDLGFVRIEHAHSESEAGSIPSTSTDSED